MTRLAARETMPYRPCAGAAVFNAAGHVFVGRRRDIRSDEEAGAWQMPQGGIDAGEDPLAGARRELFEETNIRSARLLGEVPGWIDYDLPDELLGVALQGKYRGQTQKWFAFAFDGADAEINVHTPGGGGHKPEFDAWRWAGLDELEALVVPFKQNAYRQLVEALRPIAAGLGDD